MSPRYGQSLECPKRSFQNPCRGGRRSFDIFPRRVGFETWYPQYYNCHYLHFSFLELPLVDISMYAFQIGYSTWSDSLYDHVSKIIEEPGGLGTGWLTETESRYPESHEPGLSDKCEDL